MAPHLQLLGRRQCCLCDEAKLVLEQLAKKGLCTWESVDVDRDKALLVRYGMDVPVVLLDGRPVAKHRIDAQAIAYLLQARDGQP
ncbi:MAG: glutaredoxin family protein [Zetaproteobacteria bacterium]|nr:MAG: glutaredoxin family protein [Zetaproteobacteria bacterium]